MLICISMSKVQDSPLVSVLVCNYNNGSLIARSLESVMEQDYNNIEIVFIDDGSTDESVSVVEQIIKENPKRNIVLKKHEHNKGTCYARNSAIETARGEFFVFLDSDDSIPRDYIEKLYKKIIKSGSDVAYGDLSYFGDKTGKTDFPEFDLEKLKIFNYINIASLVRKKSVMGHEFDIDLNRKSLEDYDFWLGLALDGKKFVKTKGAYYNYYIVENSRNLNEDKDINRIISFVEIWYCIINKYMTIYPSKIQKDIYLDQLKYQIGGFAKELENLNEVVESELLPELEKRESHIDYLQTKIDAGKTANNQLRNEVDKTLNSRDYKIGKNLLKPIRKLKDITKW